MDLYSSFDYLCNEPYFVPEIGNLKCPTLRDIRKITYRIFHFYVDLIALSPPDYQKLFGSEGNTTTSLYILLLTKNPHLLIGLLNFFLEDTWEFDENTASFSIYETPSNREKQLTGHIGNDNFDDFRNELKHILGISPAKEVKPKFKNNAAKELFKKLQKNNLKKDKLQDENYTLDNMILKFCTHNKTGIHILNVWDLTYYQFIRLFEEYCNARQCDFNDLMAAHTFSYKNSADYHPLEYIQKLSPN